ncbi:hypothetical protein HXX76_001225 [Chlamydomonas incerta]|uniref:Ion transport domain-containing protein n=1 Tax=Chlamydomonas incerta TaxID=51695 RepID=A0A836B1C5_CHLIN|nr:hypothetical protein HXX76_001225 [Chlamydomonas incerta]|eukprot:KAG2444473.1 hypothetical protein HXX76_001225 [Chlamydomonas incerta]
MVTEVEVDRHKDVGEINNLRAAAECGRLGTYRYLKEKKGFDILEGDWPYKYSSVLYAAYGNEYKVLQLIAHRYAATVDAEGRLGPPAAVLREREKQQAAQLRQQAPQPSPQHRKGWHWHQASLVKGGTASCVEGMLVEGGKPLTPLRLHGTPCWLGKNSVHVTAYQGHVATTLYLVELDLMGQFRGYGDGFTAKGRSVDLFTARDTFGKTPLEWAASQGHTDALEVLLLHALYRLLPDKWPAPGDSQPGTKPQPAAVWTARRRIADTLHRLSLDFDNTAALPDALLDGPAPAEPPEGEASKQPGASEGGHHHHLHTGGEQFADSSSGGGDAAAAAVAAAACRVAGADGAAAHGTGGSHAASYAAAMANPKRGFFRELLKQLDEERPAAGCRAAAGQVAAKLLRALSGKSSAHGDDSRRRRVGSKGAGVSAATAVGAGEQGRYSRQPTDGVGCGGDESGAKSGGSPPSKPSPGTPQQSDAPGTPAAAGRSRGRRGSSSGADGRRAVKAHRPAPGSDEEAEGQGETQEERALEALLEESESDEDGWADEDQGVITPRLLLQLAAAVAAADMNVLGVLLYVQDLLASALYYEPLAARCGAWVQQLLDTCQNKKHVQVARATRGAAGAAAAEPPGAEAADVADVHVVILGADASSGSAAANPTAPTSRGTSGGTCSAAARGSAAATSSLAALEDLADPISFALQVRDKEFMAHRLIQQVFTEKWDTMGISDYANNVVGAAWGAFVMCLAFSSWLLLCPLGLAARAASLGGYQLMQRGKVVVDSRFPWHVPLYRWVLHVGTLVAYVVCLSVKVFVEGTGDHLGVRITALSTALAAWSVAILVDEAQDLAETGWQTYCSDWWNLNDVVMAATYVTSWALRVASIDSPDEISLQLWSNDLLSLAVVVAYARLFSMLELSQGFGPLIQMVVLMLFKDVSRFILIAAVVLLGFGVSLNAMFAPVCLDRQWQASEDGGDGGDGAMVCVTYTLWAYNWDKNGVFGAMNYLQYMSLGYASASDLEQKRVTGNLFYFVFIICTAIVLLNLFIAMMADTYTRVTAKAETEYRYRKALIMVDYYSREAVFPPLNLLALALGLAGNAARLAALGAWRLAAACGRAARGGPVAAAGSTGGGGSRAAGRAGGSRAGAAGSRGMGPPGNVGRRWPGWFYLVPLRKREHAPLFNWFFPKGSDRVDVIHLRRRVFGVWLQRAVLAWSRERQAEDLYGRRVVGRQQAE